VAESLCRDDARESPWRLVPWWLAAAVCIVALDAWIRAFPSPVALGGLIPSILVAVGFAVLAIALAVGARVRSNSAPFAAAFACAILLAAMQHYESRLAPYDPVPKWGALVSAECREGCDTYMYGIHAYSLDFYSRKDWTIVPDLSQSFTKRLAHDKGFLVLPTDKEADLARLPFPWEVVDRAPILDKSWLAAALGRSGSAFRDLSLVRFERRPTS